MVIAAYAGCGKTSLVTLTKYAKRCIEVLSKPYARILPVIKGEVAVSFEAEKAVEYRINK